MQHIRGVFYCELIVDNFAETALLNTCLSTYLGTQLTSAFMCFSFHENTICTLGWQICPLCCWQLYSVAPLFKVRRCRLFAAKLYASARWATPQEQTQANATPFATFCLLDFFYFCWFLLFRLIIFIFVDFFYFAWFLWWFTPGSYRMVFDTKGLPQ